METIDEILEELRSGEFARLADRVEAAHKREIAEAVAAKCEVCDVQTVTDCNQPVTDCHALDDIVRKVAEEMSNTSMQDITAEIIYGWATRLGEAATCEKSSAVGNAAKMREALEWFWSKRSMLDFCHNNLSTKTWEDWDKVYRFLREFADKVQSALSAPARNCDLYKTEDEAYQAYLKVMENTPKEEQVYFESWLFAKTKGGVA